MHVPLSSAGFANSGMIFQAGRRVEGVGGVLTPASESVRHKQIKMSFRANIHLVGDGTAARRKATSLTRRNQCVVERYILWNGLSCSLATRERSFQDESEATRPSNLSSTSTMDSRVEGSACVISSTSGRRNSKPDRLELNTPPVTERCPWTM